MTMEDPYDLQRFVAAQDAGGTYDHATSELRRGRKASHWMWFIFPQHRSLGRSAMAKHFGIASMQEAQAYWQHEVLGPRLQECTELVLAVSHKTALQIFGSPDDLKFHSSMTLFAQAAPDEPVFTHALDKYFSGVHDPRSLALLAH